jgi:hypothetical protein
MEKMASEQWRHAACVSALSLNRLTAELPDASRGSCWSFYIYAPYAVRVVALVLALVLVAVAAIATKRK